MAWTSNAMLGTEETTAVERNLTLLQAVDLLVVNKLRAWSMEIPISGWSIISGFGMAQHI